MSALYSLRPELEFSAQTQHGKKYVVVKDPVTKRYLRFTENQGIILELIREPIDLESLATAAAGKFGVPVKQESLKGCSILSRRSNFSTRPKPMSRLLNSRRESPKTRTFSTIGFFL